MKGSSKQRERVNIGFILIQQQNKGNLLRRNHPRKRMVTERIISFRMFQQKNILYDLAWDPNLHEETLYILHALKFARRSRSRNSSNLKEAEMKREHEKHYKISNCIFIICYLDLYDFECFYYSHIEIHIPTIRNCEHIC